MRYAEARTQAESGRALVVSMTGGWKRTVRFSLSPDGTVDVTLFRTRILRYHPDGRVQVWTGWYRTATTRDALNGLLPDGNVWTHRKLGLCYWPYATRKPVPIHEGMVIEGGA